MAGSDKTLREETLHPSTVRHHVSIENSIEQSRGAAKLRDALLILEDVDRNQNLHPAVAIISFVVSIGFSVRAFFFISELVLWEGINEFVALMMVSMSWVLIFPILIFTFLLILTVLRKMGIRDLRSLARYRLSNLALSLDELHELRDALASREWRHGHIFKDVVADLTDGELEV